MKLLSIIFFYLLLTQNTPLIFFCPLSRYLLYCARKTSHERVTVWKIKKFKQPKKYWFIMKIIFIYFFYSNFIIFFFITDNHWSNNFLYLVSNYNSKSIKKLKGYAISFTVVAALLDYTVTIYILMLNVLFMHIQWNICIYCIYLEDPEKCENCTVLTLHKSKA